MGEYAATRLAARLSAQARHALIQRRPHHEPRISRRLYGLKYNPFTPDLPLEALHLTPKLEDFGWRIEHGLAHEGGFALITGEPGTGKSVALRVLAERLERLREVTVGCLEHPQSNLADFYREMGDLFGVALQPHNRWAGFRVLRARWLAHIDATLIRPILLIDEAQEMHPSVLNELRILTSTRFDSRSILSVVLAGDRRLLHKLRREELLPLGTRIRTRLLLEPATSEELRACLDAPDGDRGQCQADDPRAHRHALRPRPRQLPHARHHGQRAAQRRRPAPAR